MQKELNPELFGPINTANSTTGGRLVENPAVPSHVLIQSEARVAELRKEMAALANQMKSLVGQANEFMKVTGAKMDRLQQHSQKLELDQNQLREEASQKISHLHVRIGERKSMEIKVQEMIDRHNAVLRSYDMRLNHLQKIISEKDAQLLQTQSALNEAKMEIARLKRI